MKLRFLLLGAPVLLAGCSSIGSLAGAAVGIASGTGTTNPLIGYAVGVGTKAAVDELVLYLSRRRQQGEQDEIASTVGRLRPGEMAPWKIEHVIPLGNEHGDVMVAGLIANPLAPCKEVVFTVIDGDKPDSPRGTYVTTACEQGTAWKWAEAEPASQRWGFLQ